jgi:hypothetical protein
MCSPTNYHVHDTNIVQSAYDIVSTLKKPVALMDSNLSYVFVVSFELALSYGKL